MGSQDVGKPSQPAGGPSSLRLRTPNGRPRFIKLGPAATVVAKHDTSASKIVERIIESIELEDADDDTGSGNDTE